MAYRKITNADMHSSGNGTMVCPRLGGMGSDKPPSYWAENAHSLVVSSLVNVTSGLADY